MIKKKHLKDLAKNNLNKIMRMDTARKLEEKEVLSPIIETSCKKNQ